MRNQRTWIGLAVVLGVLVLVGIPGPAGAEVTQNVKVPMAFGAANPCTGDVLLLQGVHHRVSSTTQDGNGGFHIRNHSNYQGWTAEVIYGPNAGAQYRASNSANDTFNLKVGENHTAVQHISLIGRGQAPNVRVEFHWHYTINANGDLTAYVYNMETTCK